MIDLIDAETTKPIAVFAHHPPFEVPVGPDPLNFETPEMMARLRQALQHSGRVVAVFSGHVHRGTAGHVGSIPATVMPSIATTLRKGEYPAQMKTRPVYHIHRFDPVWGFATETRIVWASPAFAIVTVIGHRSTRSSASARTLLIQSGWRLLARKLMM